MVWFSGIKNKNVFMKKFLLSAFAVMALVSCSQNELDQNALTQKEMVFSNLNDRVVRASAGYKTGANDAGDDYKVYATSSLSNAVWYIEDTVWGAKAIASNVNKAQHGPYYWLNSGVKFNFLAYAPSTVGVTTKVSAGSRDLFFDNYTVPASGNEDFTVATPLVGLTSATNNGTVNLQFHHMLSKISISADLSAALKAAGYTIEGTYYASLTVPYDRADLTYAQTGVVGNWSGARENSHGVGQTTTYNSAKSYMIMSQYSANCSVQLKGLVIKKSGVQVFPLSGKSGDLKKLTLVNGQIPGDYFSFGKHYRLNFTINDLASDNDGDLVFGKEINFSAEIANWSVVDAALVQPGN